MPKSAVANLDVATQQLKERSKQLIAQKPSLCSRAKPRRGPSHPPMENPWI